MKKKITVVFGTRPEAIKMCPLVNELRSREELDVCVVVTGQHRQMLDPILSAFKVMPDHDLCIMKDEQTLFDITTVTLEKLKALLPSLAPDVVLVHGDTTTAFATALACFYLQIPVGHVEAGLRTHDLSSPYPEELNRQTIDLISRYHFAPTEGARQNLLREGRDASRIWVTGNTIVDAMRYTVRADYRHPELDWATGSESPESAANPAADAAGTAVTKDGRRMLLITAHRRENLGEPMHAMFRAIRRVLDTHPDVRAVYPVHLNPEVRRIAEAEFSNCVNIHLIEPLGAVDFHQFESRSYLCVTDSGGVSEECVSIGVPVLVMRNKTERGEGMIVGTMKLTGTSEEAICESLTLLLDDASAYEQMKKASDVYGDGHACERIADLLMKELTDEE